MTEHNAVESCCSQVLDSLLALLSTSELIGTLRRILANDENEVLGYPLISVRVLILLRFFCTFLIRFSNV